MECVNKAMTQERHWGTGAKNYCAPPADINECRVAGMKVESRTKNWERQARNGVLAAT